MTSCEHAPSPGAGPRSGRGRSRSALPALFLVVAGYWHAPASADTIFAEDFQDGEYGNWMLSGTGFDAANYYYGNYSMRLDGLRQGVIAVSSAGYEDVALSMDIAGLYLVYGDYCYAEFSLDGGASWNILRWLGDGSDDGYFRTGTLATGLDNNPDIQLRVRAYTLYYNYCYGDNISVTGSPTDGGDPPIDVYDSLDGSGNVTRTNLTYSFLTGSGTLALMDYSHYALPAEAANPVNTFEGTLTLSGEATGGNAVEVGGAGNLQYYPDAEHLPEFAFEFVQHGTHLIPKTRGKIEGTHASWAYVLEPGRVWNENGDGSFSRAALPFSLQERNNDCIWNGVLTFLFKDDGSVSDVAYQVAGDTCLYMKVNFWGRLDATYTPAAVAGSTVLKADYETEVARRMPVKPMSALAIDYPGSGVAPNNIGSDATAGQRAIYGVAVDGVHYTGGCETRYGTYPFCEVLDVPSYSVAKSVNAGYGLMRLEQKYAGTQRTLGIDEYVSECTGSQWDTPTFENALDMATGNFDSSVEHADESAQATIDDFFYVNTHAAKAGFACAYPNKAAPGTAFVYHTSDTYLLGRAMNVYYQAQAGPGADLYEDVLVKEIYEPLGLSPTTHTTLRTQDAAAQPHTGYGMILVRDDVVKLAEFLAQAEGRIGTEQILDSDMVQATLHLGNGGLPAGGSDDRYNNGFWYYDLDQAAHDYGCSAATWVPYMSGYGGITVVLFPNGTTYYHFSDNGDLGWANAAVELDKIAPMCP